MIVISGRMPQTTREAHPTNPGLHKDTAAPTGINPANVVFVLYGTSNFLFWILNPRACIPCVCPDSVRAYIGLIHHFPTPMWRGKWDNKYFKCNPVLHPAGNFFEGPHYCFKGGLPQFLLLATIAIFIPIVFKYIRLNSVKA